MSDIDEHLGDDDWHNGEWDACDSCGAVIDHANVHYAECNMRS